MAIQDFTDIIVMSNFSHDMHFSLITVYSMAKSTYYASIMLDASRHLLCSKLCQHNRLVPNRGYNKETKTPSPDVYVI